jgi:hypothetical protein
MGNHKYPDRQDPAKQLYTAFGLGRGEKNKVTHHYPDGGREKTEKEAHCPTSIVDKGDVEPSVIMLALRAAYLADMAPALLHQLLHFLGIRHPCLPTELLHHLDLAFAKSLLAAALHERLHFLEVRLAFLGTTLFHHLVHHCLVPP